MSDLVRLIERMLIAAGVVIVVVWLVRIGWGVAVCGLHPCTNW